MNSQQIAEFNRKCAEYVGIEYRETPYGNYGVIDINFNSYHDANDRNKVLEKMHVRTQYLYSLNKWEGFYLIPPENTHCIVESDYSMEAAQIACIASVLGVNQ